MTWIVLSILAAILFWAGVGTWLYGRNVRRNREEEIQRRVEAQEPTTEEQRREFEAIIGRDYRDRWNYSLTGAVVAGVTVAAWVLLTAGLMVHIAGQREVAIVYNFSGTIDGKKDAGTFATWPWQHIRKENIGIQHDEWIFDLNTNSAVSKDQQQIGAILAVNYQIDSENVVDLYKRVGPNWKTIIIDSRVPQVFKEVTSTYPTPKITEDREGLRKETRTRLESELVSYDIKVVDVFITNLGFSPQYTQSIEEKQQQVQDALRAEARVKQVQAEARQKVAEAEGEAQANVARARGEATANRLRQRSLTPLLVQQQAIEKMNPNVQLIVCPPKSVCIPNSGIVPEP